MPEKIILLPGACAGKNRRGKRCRQYGTVIFKDKCYCYYHQPLNAYWRCGVCGQAFDQDQSFDEGGHPYDREGTECTCCETGVYGPLQYSERKKKHGKRKAGAGAGE